MAAAEENAVPAQAVATAVYPAAPADQAVAAVEHTEPAVAQQGAAHGSHSTAEQAAEAAEQPEAAEGGELAVAAAEEAVEEAAATEQLAAGAGRPAVEAAAAKWSCFQIQDVHAEPAHPLDLWAVTPPLAPNLQRSNASAECEGPATDSSQPCLKLQHVCNQLQFEYVSLLYCITDSLQHYKTDIWQLTTSTHMTV